LKILVAATQPPLPPINGLRLPLQVLLRGFAARGHDVRLIALGTEEERRVYPTVPPSWRLLSAPRPTPSRRVLWLARAALNGRPMRVDDVATALLPAIEQEIAGFEPNVFLGFGFELAALPRLACPSVFAALDAMHLNVHAQAAAAPGFRRILFGQEARRVRRFEASAYGRFDRVVVVTPEDANALAALNSGLRLDVISNGVDTNEYRPHPEIVPVPGRLLLHGTMDYEPNVRAAELLVNEVLPLVRADHPDAHVILIGRAPSKRVRALAGQHVNVTGEVDDVAPWLSSGAVYVCPMITGTGMKNKLLEAMACERSCVVTPLALRGLAAEPGTDLLVADGAAGLASHVSNLLADRMALGALGGAARRYVVHHHSWDAVTAAYEDVLSRAVTARGESAS
jgi:glycosyltransferase involved in cell wall biosynthesis